MSKSRFKLIAISILDSCDQKYLKVLKADHIYYFFSNYEIKRDGASEVIDIKEDPVPEIFDVGDLKINISAIVGKNGTGKSSLIELLFRLFYEVSRQLGAIDKVDEQRVLYEPMTGLNVVLYFAIDEVIHKLEHINTRTTLRKYDRIRQTYYEDQAIRKKDQLEQIFFNLVVNYSHYALNSEEDNHWLKAIFDKNDAYQTPLIINPHRTKGNIDVNIESHLVRSRLLVNLLDFDQHTFQFGNIQKKATYLHFKLNYDKFDRSVNTGKIVFKRTPTVKQFAFPMIYEVFFNDVDFRPKESRLNRLAKEYILRKMASITSKYKHYHRYAGAVKGRQKEAFKKFLLALKDDSSHITFKLRQALNFLHLDLFPKDEEHFSMSVVELSDKIKELRSNTIPMIDMVPPSFLTFDIQFLTNDDRFSALSSGQKQRVYAFTSLVYHLKNLDSVHNNEKKKGQPHEKLIRYKYVNVIFDEIELYFHPDLQRKFVADLLVTLKTTNLNFINSINFIFITHSPFVLSDIPEQNTMYLDLKDDKAVQRYPTSNTFGGNIHELLSHNFFLDEEGYMGEHTRNIIGDTYNYLQSKAKNSGEVKVYESQGWTKTKARKVIDLIGEPVIKRALNNWYSSAFLQTKSAIDEEIERLERLKLNTTRTDDSN